MQELYRMPYEKEGRAGLIYLRPEQIRPPKKPQRRAENRNAIIRLAKSIAQYGILEPLSVRLVSDAAGFPTYELLAGHRRYAAARLLGLEKLPCTLHTQGERECAIALVMEDLEKKTLNIFETAAAYRLLMRDFRLTQEEIAARLSLSQSAVANKLRLLRLLPEEQEKILAAGLTERHARALLRLSDPKIRAEALEKILEKGYNVAAAEALIEEILASGGLVGEESASKEEKNTPEEAVAEQAEPIFSAFIPAEPVAAEGAPHLQSRRALTFTPSKGNESAPKTDEKGEIYAQNLQTEPKVPDYTAENGPERGARRKVITTMFHDDGEELPCRFALQDLRPLYNSIERSLSIFSRTGQAIECRREESDDGVTIVIQIAKRA